MLRARAFVFFCTGFAHDLASMESLDLTGRRRRILIRLQVVGGKRRRMRHMGVQRQQERGAFLHDAHPSMPVPMDASLVPLGLPKPTLQIHVVLEAWQRLSTDEESCGKAGHHSRHVLVKRRVKACNSSCKCVNWGCLAAAAPLALVSVAATRR